MHGSSKHASHDVAVLRLYDPLGDQVGFLDILDMDTYPQQWDGSTSWWKMGYPSDIPLGKEGLQPSAQSNINLIRAVADGTSLELQHDGDIEGGTSGAALFKFFDLGGEGTGPEPFVVGVTSGGKIDGPTGKALYSTDAGGWPLHSIVTFARNFLP